MKKKNKELIIYFTSTAVVSILGFVLSLLYSKMFAPSDYGEYSIAASTYNLVLHFYSGWITASIIRCFQEYENKGIIDKFYGSFFQLQIIMGIALFMIPNIIIWNLNISNLLKRIFFTYTIIYFFEESIAIINTMLRAQQNVKQYNVNTVLNSFSKIIFLLLSYYVLHIESVEIITFSLLAAEMLQYIYLFKKLNLKQFYKRGLFDFNIIKQMFKFGFPLIGVALTSWILSTSDRYIIRIFYSSTEVGLYSYAYSLGNSLFNLLIQFIMLAAYPNIVKAWENEGKEETEDVIKYYLRIYFIAIIPAIFGVISVAKDFFEGFTNVRYHESYYVFILTCISMAVVGLSQYTNKAWELSKKTKNILIFNILAAIINIVLNFSLIPIFGYQMAVITTLISYGIYLIISLIMSKNILKLKINIKSLLRIILASVGMYLTIYLLKFAMGGLSASIRMILEVMVGIFTYVILIFAFKEINVDEIKKLITQIKNRRNKNEEKEL